MQEAPSAVLHPVRVMLLDDHPVVRCGFERRLQREEDLQVVGSFASSGDLMRALRCGPCDLLVLDYLLRIDDIDGALLVRYLRILHPGVRVLVCSAYVNGPTVRASLKAGALGFYCKSSRLDELVQAIRAVASGNIYLGEEAEHAVAEPAGDEPAAARPLMEAKLTLKELEVLRCCLHGLSVTTIAGKFRRSVKTISGHKISAYRKLQIESDAQLFMIRPQLEGL